MIWRWVNDIISHTSYSYIWGNILPLLKENNLNLVNLETTLTNSHKIIPKTFNFKASPDKVKALKIANIHICNLANNHILDYDKEWFIETIITLNKENIQHFWAWKDITEAQKPVILEINNLKIWFVWATDNEPWWAAKTNKIGINYINTSEYEKLVPLIKSLRKQVDLVIFSMHWWANMITKPSKAFQYFAHTLIENWVDIFHWHSAHIFQWIEIYKNKPIFYDTWDFIDDYYVDKVLRNDLSFFYKIEIKNKEIKTIKLIPIKISNMQVNKAVWDDCKFCLERIKVLSSEFGTHLKEVNNEMYIYL